MRNLTAVILCGGKGTRLGSIGKKMPKTLVKIQGKPIIWYIVKFLKKNSFNHFILPVGYKGIQIKKYINKEKDLKNLNIDIVNTGENSSISKRIDKIKKNIKSDNFLLLNGDAIFNFNLKRFFLKHCKKKYMISFFGCATQLPYGVVGMINKKIVSFERDTNFNGVFSKNVKNFVGCVYSGISIMNKKLLKIRFKHFKNFEKELFPKIIKKKRSNFEHINGFWSSVDNEKDLYFLNSKQNKMIYRKVKKLKNLLKKES